MSVFAFLRDVRPEGRRERPPDERFWVEVRPCGELRIDVVVGDNLTREDLYTIEVSTGAIPAVYFAGPTRAMLAPRLVEALGDAFAAAAEILRATGRV